MFIGEDSYPTDLTCINNVRLWLMEMYQIPENIMALESIIAKYIDCLNMVYDQENYCIIIKIKKTGVKKMFGREFHHDSEFYYSIIPEIFYDFLFNDQSIYRALINLLRVVFDDRYVDALNYLKQNKMALMDLCHVSCLSDNIVMLKL